VQVSNQIRGVVTSEDGQPVPDVLLTLIGETPSTQISSNDGRFAFEGVEHREYQLSAALETFAPQTLTVAPSDQLIEIRLASAVTYSGLVRAADTGEPITTFEVVFLKEPMDLADPKLLPLFKTVEHPQGEFLWLEPLEGNVTVIARAPGYAPSAVVAVLTADMPVGGIQLELEPSREVHGVVTGSEQVPVDGARVFLGQTRAAHAAPAHTHTDADGSFTLDSIPLGVEQITVLHPDYVSETITLGDTDALEIALTPGGRAAGAIVADVAAGQAIDVTLTDAKGKRQSRSVTSNEEFEFTGCAEGDADLTVRYTAAAENPTIVTVERQVAVTFGAPVDVSIDLEAQAGRVTGRVLLDDVPTANVAVSIAVNAEDGSTQRVALATEADGTFAAEQLPEGNGYAEVRTRGADPRGYASTEFVSGPGVTAEVSLEVPGLRTLSGTVLNTVPAERVFVAVLPPDIEVPYGDPAGMADMPEHVITSVPVAEDGTFQIPEVSEGTFKLSAAAVNPDVNATDPEVIAFMRFDEAIVEVGKEDISGIVLDLR